MNEAVLERELPKWSGTHVKISNVVNAVDELRKNELRASTRTSVATLVIVSRDDDETTDAEEVIAHLGVRHPARIVNLLVPPKAGEGPDNVDAEVHIHAGEAEGHAIWSDEIRLSVSGGPARHLASLLRPLQLPDLPVVAWFVRGLPDEGDPLLKLADAVIVDSKTATDPGEGESAVHSAFGAVGLLTRKHTIIDLSWNRLAIWRRLLASQFDGELYRPFINGVERIEITGKLGPRTLLAGWLASRLGISRDVFHLYDGRHVSIVMTCRAHGQVAEFRVERLAEDRLVKASGVIEGGASHSELLGLPNDALPLALVASLQNLDRDRIYEQSIKTAGGWL